MPGRSPRLSPARSQARLLNPYSPRTLALSIEHHRCQQSHLISRLNMELNLLNFSLECNRRTQHLYSPTLLCHVQDRIDGLVNGRSIFNVQIANGMGMLRSTHHALVTDLRRWLRWQQPKKARADHGRVVSIRDQVMQGGKYIVCRWTAAIRSPASTPCTYDTGVRTTSIRKRWPYTYADDRADWDGHR